MYPETEKNSGSGGFIRIAVLSDTHGLLRREVVAEIQDCSSILHAGDIIRESDLDELGLYGSLYAVFGNNDVFLPWACRLKGILRFSIGGVRFLMTHERRNVPRDLADVDAVIFGHTHRYSEEHADGRLWLNPGSCGHSRFGEPLTLAKVDIRQGRIVRVQRIDLKGGSADPF